MATDITYITVDSTHRIEIMPSGNHYPQRLINPQFLPQGEAWGYYKTGNKQKSFKTESGACRFLTRQGQDCAIPEQAIEEDAKPEPTKIETRYRVRVKTFENEIKNYPASTKKEADEIFSRESHPLHSPMENYQVQLQDSGRERTTWSLSVQCDLTRCGSNSRTREEYEAWKVAQVKPQLTPETITYTIVERDEQGKSPFFARVLVPGQEVQDFDPIRRDEWWKHTKSDLVFAVNKAFKGAWYLKPEVFEKRIMEQTQEGDWIKKSYARAQELGIELTGICCTCGKLKSINAEGECNDCASLEDIVEEPTYQIDGEDIEKPVPQELTSWLDDLRQYAQTVPSNPHAYDDVHKVEWTLADGTHKERTAHTSGQAQDMVELLMPRQDVTSILVDGVEQRSSELTDEQRQAILAQKRAESAAYLARMDREIQAYRQEEIARSQIQQQVELQHKERITTMDQSSFWKPGSIVKLQGPYKPSEPPDALLKAISGAGSTYHQMIQYDKWHGFTHGIIAQVYAHDHQGNVSNVSLHLYDPELHVIYIDNAVGIPMYVDYHISELTPYKDGSLVGYEVIR